MEYCSVDMWEIVSDSGHFDKINIFYISPIKLVVLFYTSGDATIHFCEDTWCSPYTKCVCDHIAPANCTDCESDIIT